MTSIQIFLLVQVIARRYDAANPHKSKNARMSKPSKEQRTKNKEQAHRKRNVLTNRLPRLKKPRNDEYSEYKSLRGGTTRQTQAKVRTQK